MRSVAMFVITVVVGSGVVYAAPHTWTGQISDSMCGAKHKPMGNMKMTDREKTKVRGLLPSGPLRQ